MWVQLALVVNSIAAISGILAVGSGRHWDFKIFDYFRGKRNAILYLWVTMSTITAIYVSGVIAQYGIEYGWRLRAPESWPWFIGHISVGLLFTFAHVFVATVLSKQVGPVDKYLWGNRRAAD
jgi:hypothetical protein